MHTAPAVSVQVDPEPRWRMALAALGVLSAFTVLAWFIHKTLNTSAPWPLWIFGLALSLFVLTGWAAWQSWRLRTPDCISLQWDGADWTVVDRRCQASTGDVAVVIDLGGWMLLRFMPDLSAHSAARRRVWIPLSERQLPRDWHALRCAVHGARPIDPGGHSHGH
jgi:hypothetical protein